MAISAFILIEVAGDHTKSGYKTIQRIAGVKAVYTVSGNYDLIVQVEAENLETLSTLLLSNIRAVDGVDRRSPCSEGNFVEHRRVWGDPPLGAVNNTGTAIAVPVICQINIRRSPIYSAP